MTIKWFNYYNDIVLASDPGLLSRQGPQSGYFFIFLWNLDILELDWNMLL